MASKNEAKVTFTAETADLNKAISSANSELTKLRSELKLNEAQAKSTGDSMDSLKDRARILGEEYEASQSKVDALSSKLDAAKAIFGENSTEAQRLETQLNNARIAQERIAQQIEQTNAAMSQMESSSAQAASALGRMESEVSSQESELQRLKSAYNEVAAEQGEASDEARQLASQISKTSGELQESRSKLDSASTAADKFDRTLDQLGDSAKDAGGDFDTLDVALGNIVADMAGSAWDAVSGLEEETRQYRLEQSKLAAQYVQTGQATIDNAAEVSRLSDEYLGFYRLTGDETLASTAASNINAMGLEQSNLNDLLTAASGIWTQYGDSIPLDGLAESVNETANTGTVTGSLADALNWATTSGYELGECLSSNTAAQAAYNKAKAEGATNEDAFNAALAACTTEQERQQLITDTLYSAYGELGDTYNELSADAQNANQAQAELTDAQAQLADAISPVQTQLTYLISDGMEWLANNLPIVTPLVTGLAVAFGGFVVMNTVLPAVKGVMDTLKAAPTVLSAIGGPATVIIGVIAALAAGFMYLWNTNEDFRNGVIEIWNSILAFLQPIFDQISLMVQTYWPVIQQTISNVMTTIWTVIQTVWPIIQQIFATAGTVIQTIVQTVWPIIQSIISSVVTNVQNLIAVAWPYIQSLTQTVMTFIQAFIDNVWPHIQNVIQTVMSVIQTVISSAWPVIQGIFQTAGAVIQTVINTVFPVIQGIITTVMGVIQGVIQTVTGIISGDWSAVWEGISQVASSIWEGISSTISGVIEGIASTIGSVVDGISSTISSVFSGISSTASSIWNGIKDTIGGAINGARDLVGSAIDAIKGFFNFEFRWPHIPLPHFSISGSINPLDWLTQGVPQISVSWYAEGGIMDEPTIFGVAGGQLLGGGEAGPEAIAPIDKLQAYVQDAVDSRMGNLGALVGAIEDLADRVISIEIDGRQLARATASDSDRVSGSRQRLSRRGVSLA